MDTRPRFYTLLRILPLLLAMPFPYIANTAGWFTTELGRQPWVVFGLQPIALGSSSILSSGNVLFTLIGFAGIYVLLGILYVVLVVYEMLGRGPAAFFSWCAFIGGMLASAAFGLYPLVLPAVNPANSLTIQNASGSQYGQTVRLVWWSIAMILAAIYFIFIYRLFRGKIRPAGPGGH